MTRIKIEDLPVAENLTPEQEELIQGAGLQPFRPSIEALEDRQLMAAHLGAALPLKPPVLDPAAVSVRSLPASSQGHAPLQQTQAALPQAARDQMFADLGRQGLPQGQQSPSVQGDSQHVQDVAEKILKENIIEGGKNRWLFVGASRAGMEVQGDQIKVRFQVAYGFMRGIEGYPMCEVEFTFQGKNTGGVKRYDLVGAGLRDWNGFTVVGNQFESVAKEIFRNVLGDNGIWRHRFDENVFADNVIRQAEKLWGVKEGTFEKCKIERIDGGFRVLMYTDNNPFNPMGYTDVLRNPPVGRGELWLTFKYDDAQLATGSLKVSEIRQGYHWIVWLGGEAPSLQQWRDTGDASLHARLRDASWSVPPV